MTSFQAELIALILRHGNRLSFQQMLQVLQQQIEVVQHLAQADCAAIDESINQSVDEAAKNPVS